MKAKYIGSFIHKGSIRNKYEYRGQVYSVKCGSSISYNIICEHHRMEQNHIDMILYLKENQDEMSSTARQCLNRFFEKVGNKS